MKLRGAAVLSCAILMAACGRGSVGTAGSISHPTGADETIVRIELEGGFMNPEHLLRRVPQLVILGDRTLVTAGPQIQIYPGPALPNLLGQSLTEEAVQRILETAREHGMFEDRHLGQPRVADAPTTVFIINAEGKTFRTSVDALGIDEPRSGDRGEVLEFYQMMLDLQSWLPEGSIGPEEPYRPSRLQIVFQPAELSQKEQPDELDQDPKPWPLATPPSELGVGFETFSGLAEARCAGLEGQDADEMFAALSDANELTEWVADDRRWLIYPKPLLGGEMACDHPLRDPPMSPEVQSPAP